MSIFISNINYAASEQDLRNFLARERVPIRSATLLRNGSTGTSLGKAIIELHESCNIDNTINRLQGLYFMNRKLNIRQHNPNLTSGSQATPVSQDLGWLNIPMEFRAQVKGRCQRQYFKATILSKGQEDTAVNHWINEWTQAAKEQLPFQQKNLKTIDIKIDWRLLANSGLDEGIIRPVIAAGGWPIIPGSSIKGLCRKYFRDSINEASKLQRWFGNSQEAGIIRFHGAWPSESSWKKGLLDLTHPQQNWQIGRQDRAPQANVVVSLYKPTLSIGLSSRDSSIDKEEWNAIEQCVRQALSLGIGGRTSAGYGHSSDRLDNAIFTCCIEGYFPAPKLLDQSTEFRPTMFRAMIRGMALRLFAGLTTENLALSAVDKLFGTLQSVDDRKPRVGLLAARFHVIPNSLSTSYVNAHEAISVAGTLAWTLTRDLDHPEKEMLQDLLASLHGLVMSLGGFGRSWRRPAHTYFYHKTRHYSKLVGCHWQWRETVQSHLWIHPSTREELQVLLQNSRTCARKWLEHTHQLPDVNQQQSLTRPNWREVIHPEQMLIWCRSAKNARDARAVNWFHERPSEDSSQNNQPWKNQDSAPKLYRTDLAGRVLNKKIDNYSTLVGSIWNRMLPVYANNIPFNPQNEFELHSGCFLEIFTIFKHSDNKDSHEFKKLCKHLNSGQSGFFNIKF